VSGGDPFYRPNALADFLQRFKLAHPDKSVWVYTGFTWETLLSRAPLPYIDVLVDGQYKEDLKDYTSSFRGSTNQRFIDVPRTLETGKVTQIIF
jgi:anaerobic ribonucleoside-triphosphate reductase activating protein